MRSICFYRVKDKIFGIGSRWDKLAPSEDEAIEFAHKYINEEPDPRIDEANWSLAHYGEIINSKFRDDEIDETGFRIAAVFNEHVTKRDLILYRGVNDYVYSLMKEKAKESPNCDLYEKGFLACSIVKGHEINAEKKLRIYVPAGSKCVYQGNINEEQYYYEVDVMHGASLKVVSIDSEYINCKLLETE